MAAAQYYDEIQQAYLAYYGRPADPAGLAYWATQLSNAGGNLNSIINAFGTSAESTALYGGSNTAAQITAIYQTLFGRAPDAAGLNFYENGIATGQFTLASVALNIYYGAQNADATALAAKLVYADAFTNALEASPSAQVAYSGTAASTNARAAVGAVVDTTSEAAAAANLSTTIANIGTGSVGQTVTLTTGVDNFTPTGNAAITGVVGNSGLVSATFNGFDKIAATGTNNSLNITDVQGGQSLPAGAAVTGVQTLNWSSNGTVGILNTTGFTGLTALNVTEAGGNGGITAAGTTAVTVNDAALGGTLAVPTSISVLGGSNVAVTAAGVTGGTVTVGSATAAPTGTIAVTVTDVAPGAFNSTGGLVGGTVTAGAITTTGGTTVSVAENINAATSTNNVGAVPGALNTAIGGAVTINGTATTTSAAVTQSAAVTAVAGVTGVPAVAAATAVDTVTWQGLSSAAGSAASESIGGVTVTSTGGTFTAVQVATVANGGTVAGLLATNPTGVWTVAQTGVGTGGTSVFTDATPNTAANVGTGSVTAAAPVPTATVVSAAGSAAATAQDTVTWAAFTAAGTQVIGGVTVTATGAFSANQVAQVVNGGTPISGLTATGQGTTWNVTGTNDGTVAISTFTDTTVNTPATLVGNGTFTGGGAAPAATLVVAGNAATAAQDTVTWSGLTAGTATAATETIGGVTVTAAAGSGTFTAAQVASAAAGTTVAGLTVANAGGTTGWTVTNPTAAGTTTFTYNTTNTAANVGVGSSSAGLGAAPTATVVNAGSAGSAGTAAVTAVGGVADGAVLINDVNATSTTKAGTITTVSLSNYSNGAVINDNNVQNLTLAGKGGGVQVNSQLTTPVVTTLNLNANAVTDATAGQGLTDAGITTLNVVTGGAAASKLLFTDAALTTVNVSGTQNITLTPTSTAITAVNVSGGAGVTLAIGAGTAFTSTSTGTDVVTISAAATKAVAGNGTAAEEIVWNGTSAPASTAYLGTVTGFKVLGIGAATVNESFDLSKITGFTGIDVLANANTGTQTVSNVTAGSPLSIDGNYAGTLQYFTADANGTTDSLALTLGTATTKTALAIGGLTLGDSQQALDGLGNVTVTVNDSGTGAAGVATIGALSDASLTNLTVQGTGGLMVTNLFTDNATALTINGTSTNTQGITFAGGITDSSLKTLTLTGTDNITLGSTTVQGVVEGGKGLVVNGSADNANVFLNLSGATTQTANTVYTDSITLGNGTNTVIDTAAIAGNAVNITVGTGANTISVGGAATNTIALGAHGATVSDSVSVAGAATVGATYVPTATVTGFNDNGADKIVFAGDTGAMGPLSTFSAAQITSLLGNTSATLTTIVNAVLTNVAAGNPTIGAHGVGEFVYQGNTYVVEQAHGAGAAFSAGDSLVQLTGTHTLTSASAATSGTLFLHG